MNEELKQLLFTHQGMQSPAYYFSGTLISSVAVIGLILIIIYTIYNYIKNHKGVDLRPEEFEKLRKFSWRRFVLIVLSSSFTFIISAKLFPKATVTGWAEDTGMLLIFPFMAAIFIGGFGKLRQFQDNILVHSLSFWRVYLFTFTYLGLRVIFF